MVKHIFRGEYEYGSVTVETQEEMLEEILRAFKHYLKGCGYEFDGEIVEEEK
jgi:hypothetical protein